MKPKYKTFFTRKAYEDLRDIYRYIKEELQNNSSAIKIVDEVEERIATLEEYPLSGSLVQDEILQRKGYRKLIINNYIALYTTDDQQHEVHIIRIIYGKRDYQDLI
ncbi:MAG: type II toxin-antitoxin system RelE/ParE family toxin [Spirochaetaceae bacterium]|nr:type II toxin-antitoxin system RelE/ParE family toxin [Spirochaetaceae bacterium]